jgi:hypothetical protein
MRPDDLTGRWRVSFPLALISGVLSWGANQGRATAIDAHRAERDAPHERAAPARTRASVQQWYELEDVAAAALKAGRTQEARTAAEDLLAGAPGRERDWNYGNAIHNGNMILGKIALDSGDVQKAKDHLIAAGKSPGSPQLDTFGPDLKFAEELLDKGEGKTTAEYLRLISNFWKPMKPRLDAWATAIDHGERPRLDRRATQDPRDDRPLPPENEIVMSPGTSITATTATGTMTVKAGQALERSYTWEGATRSVRMDRRTKPWYGSYGIYFPGPGEHWQDHNGITRGVLEEGQQHFDTLDEAMQWLRSRNYMPYVWTDDGLVVGWMKVPVRKQLTVEVWQVYVNGKKPERMPESQDDKISITSAAN